MQNLPTIHIGIIGGMGPQASALLHTMLIQACTEQLGLRDCHEFPLITHVSIPAIDFISRPELRAQNAKLLQRAAQTLTTTPLDMAIIACNTAHILVDEMPELQQLPLISLPESVLAEAKNRGVQRIGLIASPTTLRMKLYENHAQKHGISIVTASAASGLKAERVIRSTIAGKAGLREVHTLHQIAEELRSKGAELIVLGCTELSVAMQGHKHLDMIDSLQATTNAAIGRMRVLNKEPSNV